MQSVWEELKCRGNRPPCLQEHSMVCWKNTIYVFGGEIGFASTGETPLWILDLNSQTWKKHHVRGSAVHQPSGRRGHSAVVFDGAMHVFGGYQDLRGSSSELWMFDLGAERWSLIRTPSYFAQPPPRHNHSCVIHDDAMWVYGGLADLQPRGDFWKWDFISHQWSRVKTQRGPGELHGHAAVKGLAYMYIFGGERCGIAINELWRFHFGTETWEKINAEGIIPPPRMHHIAVPNPALNNWEARVHAWGDSTVSSENGPNRTNPPKSISMCFGQTNAESEGKKYFKFRVHPVSRFCSKNTSSDEDDDEEYTASYNQSSAQLNLRTLRDKFHSSRLVRSISSGSYSILHNQSANEARKDELEKLVEESTPHQQHRPRLKIQKSQSSEAVLESDGEATPQHKQHAKPNRPGTITDSPPLWVENPNTLLRSSWSESTFQHSRHSMSASSSRINGGEHHSTCTTPTTRIGRLAFDGPLSTVRDVIEENSENADEPNMIISTEQNEMISSTGNKKDNTAILVDLNMPNENLPSQNNHFKSSHTISDFASQAFSPCTENHELPHSVSHSSGYHSFTEDENNFECHREFAGCLNTSATRKHLPRCRDLELKTFSPNESQNGLGCNGDIILPPPPVSMERARSLDRASQRKLVRSYPSGGSITPTVLMSTSVVEDSFVSRTNQRVARVDMLSVPRKRESVESPNRHWSLSPARPKYEQHDWQLCFYMFGGREQSAPGVYRQPISIWKLYV
ncbi:LOW QUALITY PROTEIN: uncharacterized protein LOC118190290 [Stegodyphus dumicola]|uniref:LOW QUALITY PROTEIN: uncharacterized protein LOC118190290 n=1 Tax=Stegodyphus dumicola TaxID=202533 RepID=UPI0015A8A784|nr:LOW QUALITY PROTEIN: uncharacterized protein LOC118190290 [Stegodyphus dumicola]